MINNEIPMSREEMTQRLKDLLRKSEELLKTAESRAREINGTEGARNA
jgi:hypothetical protein